MSQSPREKVQLIKDSNERRTMLSLMNSIDNDYGMDFGVEDGHVVSIQMAATGLVVIPRQFKEFGNLRRLELPANKIKRLRNLEFFKNLEILNLADNELTTEGLRNLNHCAQLLDLNLSMNNIDSMEPLSGMQTLEKLDLSQNLLTEISYIASPALKSLNILGNKIKHLENLHLFKNLEEVKISAQYLPPEEQALVQGESIEDIKEYCS